MTYVAKVVLGRTVQCSRSVFSNVWEFEVDQNVMLECFRSSVYSTLFNWPNKSDFFK